MHRRPHPTFVQQLDPTLFGYIGLLGYLEVFSPIFPLFYPLFFLFLYPVVEWIAAIPESIRSYFLFKGNKGRFAFVYLRVVLKPWLGCIINPFMLWNVVVQFVSETTLALKFLIWRPDLFCQGDRLPLLLPFQGQWAVVNGGVDRKHSHSWRILNQRYAYDFVTKGDETLFGTSRVMSLDHYKSFGQPICAPADGRVIRVVDGYRDYSRGDDVDIFAKGIFGNYIMIEHQKGIVSELAHLQKGSIRVKPGDVVRCGQVIACCGNSGNTTQPHLHFQIQTSRIPFFGFGLPIVWSHLWVEDSGEKKELVNDYIQKGMIVENEPIPHPSADRHH